MILRTDPPRHLTYCLNIHPGESLAEVRSAIETKTRAVKAAVSPDRPFGLGLRLGIEAAHELADRGARAEFRERLSGAGLYAFTINGFPYGDFHRRPVKERVYAPDWRTDERLAYTTLLADILADLLPPGTDGSISTVPGSFRKWIASDEDEERMAGQLAACARRLADLRERTGREIHLGLEPEPACFLESADDAVRFFQERLFRRRHAADAAALRTHVGICLDTSHAAVAFEDPAEALRRLEAEGIRLSKIQISAALETENTPAGRGALRGFVEPVYLHQTRLLTPDGGRRAWDDLPDALAAMDSAGDGGRIRVHFHVPLGWAGGERLASTFHTLTPAFAARALRGGCRHLEIETYTFDVLPPALRDRPVTESIAAEFAALERLGLGPPSQAPTPDA